MLISGCDKTEPQTDVMKDKIKDEKVTSNINNVDNKKENIIIYFPNENATALLPEVRNIKSGSNEIGRAHV